MCSTVFIGHICPQFSWLSVTYLHTILNFFYTSRELLINIALIITNKSHNPVTEETLAYGFSRLSHQMLLWPWHYDFKIHRGHTLAMGNLLTKFDKLRLIPSQVINQKSILHKMSLWPWSLTSKSMKVIYCHGQCLFQVRLLKLLIVLSLMNLT